MPNTVLNPFASTQPDGAYLPNDATGRSGEKLVSDAVPSFYNMAIRGQLFHGSSAKAGVTIPVFSSTAPTFGLWNTSTTKNAVLLSFRVSFISGTPAAAGLIYNYLNAGFAIGTAAPISAFTGGASTGQAVNANPAGPGSAMTFIPGTATLTAAGTQWSTPGIADESTSVGLGTDAGGAVDPINGMLIVPPGYFWYPTATIAFGSVCQLTLVWAELPV